jgi:hypothetical protein
MKEAVNIPEDYQSIMTEAGGTPDEWKSITILLGQVVYHDRGRWYSGGLVVHHIRGIDF